MIIDLFFILLPMFLLLTGGVVFSWAFSISGDQLVKIVTDFFMPLFVFFSLYTSNIEILDAIKLGGATSFINFFLIFISILYCRLCKIDMRTFMLPIIFMNIGFLGIPIMNIWGGAEAMNIAVICSYVQTIYIFTIGIVIVTGHLTLEGIVKIFKTPLLWSVILGFMFRYIAIEIPDTLLQSIHYAGAGAPALAIFALGCTLKKSRIKFNIHLLSGLMIRFGFGFLAGFIAVNLFNINGLASVVIMVSAALPSASFAAILPLRFDLDATFASEMILVSTILSLFIIPVIFYLSNIIRM